MDITFVIGIVVALVAIVILFKTAVVVPQQSAYVVEKLGRFSRTVEAGFHILIPFIEKVAYRHTLKERAIDVQEQICITADNVQVGVDGVLYLQVMDAERASYGIGDYLFAIAQLAQTTLRSEIGRIELDRTFEERSHINARVVEELDQASNPWGVKVLRYEIRNINPPRDVLQAMEKQMRAEREKRATILNSQGDRDAKINQAEGEKQRVIKESEAAREQQINEAEGKAAAIVRESEAARQKQINEAQGEAAAILAVAEATAKGIREVASAVSGPGGEAAMRLRVAEDYLQQFGNLAREGNTLIVPANLSDVSSMIAAATSVIAKTR